jgi:AcrR family transcriptional regulator
VTKTGHPVNIASTRERIISTAAQLTAELGWSRVTMSLVAQRVGVSRQTVYNEFGSRADLAESMVLAELSTFMEQVDVGFAAHPDDVVAALVAAAAGVRELAETNPLLGAIVTATHGGESELLPLLTTRADAVIAAAHSTVTAHLLNYEIAPDVPVDAVVDMIVRAVLSHVMQPGSASVEDAIAWLASSLVSS